MGLWNTLSGKTLRHKVGEDEVHVGRDENMHNGSDVTI